MKRFSRPCLTILWLMCCYTEHFQSLESYYLICLLHHYTNDTYYTHILPETHA
jgi:hypothetical protein